MLFFCEGVLAEDQWKHGVADLELFLAQTSLWMELPGNLFLSDSLDSPDLVRSILAGTEILEELLKDLGDHLYHPKGRRLDSIEAA